LIGVSCEKTLLIPLSNKKLLFFDKKVANFFGDSKKVIIFAPKLIIV